MRSCPWSSHTRWAINFFISLSPYAIRAHPRAPLPLYEQRRCQKWAASVVERNPRFSWQNLRSARLIRLAPRRPRVHCSRYPQTIVQPPPCFPAPASFAATGQWRCAKSRLLQLPAAGTRRRPEMHSRRACGRARSETTRSGARPRTPLRATRRCPPAMVRMIRSDSRCC